MTFRANGLARLLVAIPTSGLMPLSLCYDAANNIRTRADVLQPGLALVDLVTDSAVRFYARLIEVRAVFEIVLRRSGAGMFLELHRRPEVDMAIPTGAQFLSRRMNVAAITFLMAREACRDHPIIETMTVVASERRRTRWRPARIKVRLMGKAFESELVQGFRKIRDLDFLQRVHQRPLAVTNNAQRTLG